MPNPTDLQEALHVAGGVFRSGSVVPVREQNHHPVLQQPFSFTCTRNSFTSDTAYEDNYKHFKKETTESKKPFTSRDEGIENNLGSVKEISKLSLPDWQELWLSDTHPVLKAQNSLFRERAVAHLKMEVKKHAT